MARTTTETKQATRLDTLNHIDALRRLEKRAHRHQELICSEEWYYRSMVAKYPGWDDMDDDPVDAEFRASVAKILGYIPAGLVINGDPRGYCLKVEPEHAGDLVTDWGGYGILAPSEDTLLRNS